MPTTIVLDGEHLRLEDIAAVARGGATVTLSDSARRGIERSRAVIETMLAASALQRAGIQPLRLGPKEGLALINGTQLITAVGTLALLEAEELAAVADIAGACTLEALKGSHRAFDPRLHALRPHRGQIDSAANLRALLEGSDIARSHEGCGRVQDSYSLRCMPQVHGSARDG